MSKFNIVHISYSRLNIQYLNQPIAHVTTHTTIRYFLMFILRVSVPIG